MLTLKNSFDKIENFKRTLYSSDSPTLEKMFIYLKRLINKRKLLPKRAKNFFQSVLKKSVSGSVKYLRLLPPLRAHAHENVTLFGVGKVPARNF